MSLSYLSIDFVDRTHVAAAASEGSQEDSFDFHLVASRVAAVGKDEKEALEWENEPIQDTLCTV